jgi:nitrite reductase/ring-hydroxylating ferredoxin subunit
MTAPSAEHDPDERNEQGGREQDGNESLQGFMTNEEWDDLLAHVNKLVQQMEELPDPRVRKQVFDLLQGIDAIHRESLTRLVRLFKEGVLEQVITDPAIHTLMELYDLLPEQRGGESGTAEESTRDESREHISIRVLGQDPFPGTGEEPPHWVPVLGHKDELEEGATTTVTADDRELLLCRVGERCFAVDARCPRDGASLEDATLQRYTLTCAHHEGCYYDVRNGARLGGGEGLECFALQVDDKGRVLVGFGVPFRPELPAF